MRISCCFVQDWHVQVLVLRQKDGDGASSYIRPEGADYVIDMEPVHSLTLALTSVHHTTAVGPFKEPFLR